MSGWKGAWAVLRSVGHGIFYTVMAFVILIMIVVGVADLSSKDQPVSWGTFTEEATNCSSSPRGHCTQTGTWVSDDGRVTQRGAILDGSVDPGKSVRAGYRPGDALGDGYPTVVHTAEWIDAGPWVSCVLVLVAGAAIWRQRRVWRSDRSDSEEASQDSDHLA